MIARLLLAGALLLTSASCADMIRTRIAPPARRVETTPPRPSPAHTWIPGQWVWNKGRGTWRWQPGAYVLTPKNARGYRPGRWEQRGVYWVWVPGRWLY